MKKLLLFAWLLSACGSDDSSGIGAVCPPTNPPTYESAGKAFLDKYCVGCHSSSRTGAMRFGAPAGLNYDTLADVRTHLSDIEDQAAAGPDGTNTLMPLGQPVPTLAERTVLGEFLACEKAK